MMAWPKIATFILLHLCTLSISRAENKTVKEQEMKEQTSNNDTIQETSQNKSQEAPPVYSKILSSNASLYDHLDWGEPEDRLWKGFDPTKRYYAGYGPCTQRWPVSLQHILGADQVHSIISTYAEMFRKDCLPSYIQSRTDLFEKGYARLERDHSIGFSKTTILFVRPNLSFQNMDDLDDLLEFASFTQTYMAWANYPLNPLDPLGNQLSNNCFIEIVARLHALDLIIAVSKRNLERVAYLMGVKLKPVLLAMCADYRKIKGYGGIVEKRRAIAKQCLAVTMGLFEFLFKKSATALKSRCAHEAFKEYFKPRATAYQKLARKYGRLQ